MRRDADGIRCRKKEKNAELRIQRKKTVPAPRICGLEEQEKLSRRKRKKRSLLP